MNVLQTPVRFYPYIGGVENYVYNLSRELARLGQDVQVICAREPRVQTVDFKDGIKIKRLSYIGKIANTNITPALPFALISQDFDIIHTHLPTPWSADWSLAISRIKNKPLVITYHNDIIGQGLARYIADIYNSTGLTAILSAASKIVVTQERYIKTSPYLKNYCHKVKVLPNGVDLGRFAPSSRDGKQEESKVLFFLGLLDKYHRYKGLEELLEAIVLVRERIPAVKLIVGGGGELLNEYKKMAECLGISKNVEFPGFIADEELPDYYHNCDAFILPSLSSDQEGFGIVLLEAMACGRPVISTDIVGVAKDVRRTGSGIIVKPRDSNVLAQAIMEILKDEGMAEEMGRKGRSLVEEKYDWRKIARDMLGIYEELV
jgi:glycosyltransferase involved in cell wall biosynthesis